MTITRSSFGLLPTGQTAELFTLTNKQGSCVKVTNYGGIITEIHVPDKTGKLGNVVVGFASVEAYLKPHPYLGATIGRFANRIAKGTFTLDGKTYHLPINNNGNSLHGGLVGFDKTLWQAEIQNDTLVLTHLFPDGDQGFPGQLNAVVTFTFNDEHELILTFGATTTAATPVNMCHHAYFNLTGSTDQVDNHIICINGDHYTKNDALLIPTGEILPVAGTVLDLTKPTALGSRFNQPGLVDGGYDHNFVIKHLHPGALTLAGTATEPVSGRVMEVLTNQPAIQLYTGIFHKPGYHGINGTYVGHASFCLETQHFPDSPNHPNFPNTILRPGEKYDYKAIYHFRTI